MGASPVGEGRPFMMDSMGVVGNRRDAGAPETIE
jgi:hypothetical protein